MTQFVPTTQTGRVLYAEAAALPVVDYHNHLPVAEFSEKTRFTDLYDLWVAPDPYKHRAMRMCGVPEALITGGAPKEEKFAAWCGVFPRLVGSPLYVWSKSELDVFGIDLPVCRENARAIYERANAVMQDGDFTPGRLFDRFRVERACPCASVSDDLTVFRADSRLAPSLRGDDAAAPHAAFLQTLEKMTGERIDSLEAYRGVLLLRLDAMRSAGCRFADHALDDGFLYFPDDGKNDARFARILRGETLGGEDAARLFSHLLLFLCCAYAKRRFVLQLHIGARRKTSSRLQVLAGPAGGYAAIGRPTDIASLTAFLDDLEKSLAGLPKIVLFAMNPADNAAFSALSGSYAKDGAPGLVTQGPAWWWCDHKTGIVEVLECTAAYGLLSNFLGMTTDSRSFLSLVRHDYFRRILCDWLGKKLESGEIPATVEEIRPILYDICCGNAKKAFAGEGETR